MLKWRDENRVDDIRNQILYGGMDSPFKFPNGKTIINLAPQIIVSSKALDYKGQPLGINSFIYARAIPLSLATKCWRNTNTQFIYCMIFFI